MQGLNLIARRAAEPAGNVNLIGRAKKIDHQIIDALLEPEVLVGHGGGGEVDRAVGRAAGIAIVDRVLAEAGTKLIACRSGTTIEGLVVTCVYRKLYPS